MLERDLERRFREGVKQLGGVIHKLDARAQKGAPDRVVTINGKTIYVELKTDTGRLSPLQQVEISRIAKAGGDVRVLYGAKALEVFLATA